MKDMAKTMKRILFIYLPILIVGIIILSNAFVIRPNEYGIIRQFGKIVRVIDTEGLNFKIPFIQSLSKLPKRIVL